MAFDSCLKALEAYERKVTLETFVVVSIACRERVLCGLGNGDLCLLSMRKSVITKLESPNELAEASCLAWVGTDKCVSGHSEGPSRLWDVVECKESAVLDAGDREESEYDTAVAAAAESLVVIGSNSGDLRLWDVAQLKLVGKVKAHEGSISCICLTEDKCITGSDDRIVKVWRLGTLEELASLHGHTDRVNFIAVTKKGKCVSGSSDKTVRIWDLNEYTEVACYKGHQYDIKCVKEIDEDLCVSTGNDHEDEGENGEIRVWSLKDLSDIYVFPDGGDNFEVQSDILYSGTSEGLVCLNLRTKQITATCTLKADVRLVHYFEGRCACIYNYNSSEDDISIVDLDEYKEMHELRGHPGYVKGVLQWGSDKLISWSKSKYLRIWDAFSDLKLGELKGHTSEVQCAALTADGRCISGDINGLLKVWDLSEMKEIPTNMQLSCCVYRLVVLHDGSLFSIDMDGCIVVWDLTNYTKTGEPQEGKIHAVSCVNFVSDEIAVIGSATSTVYVLNIANLNVLAELQGHKDLVTDIAKASGNRCVTASEDKSVRVWDLQNYAELAALQGHSAEVTAVAVLCEKCVSGSQDKSIVIWSLASYLQEVKFLFSFKISHIVFINDYQFASGHENGEVKVWTNFREEASFKGHSSRLASLMLLNDTKLASSSADEKTVKIWDLGQLSNCLALCADHESLRREISEKKPVPDHFRSRIPDFRNGSRVPNPACQMLFRPYFFNALHICAYYNHPQLLTEYLQDGVPLVCGIFGSPLTLALQQDTIECVDAILDYLTALASKSDSWKSFQVINDDIPTLLGCCSSSLESFFGVLMQRPLQQLPHFIIPTVSLPLSKFITQFYVKEPEIFDNSPGTHGENLVNFRMSLIYWNFIAGSEQSIELLTAATNCDDKRVLLAEFFRTLISYKWENCFPFTFFVAIAYGAMLFCLMGTINLGSEPLCIAYLTLNSLFALYELVQMIATQTSYFTEGWNIVDFMRCTLSISWASFKLMGSDIEKFVTLIVVLLDFIRGFTHFRSFRMTRIFVYMTFTVVAEVYSFLVILAYSIFAFGIFTSVLVGETSLSETWKKAYNMAMGNFDTTGYGALEWMVFTGATVTNVVIMMNLLISILGEAYGKAQTTMQENDLHMQASLLLEYETMMTWRRKAVSKMWVMTCRKAEGGEQLEWSERVVQTVNSLSSGLSRVESEITGKVANVEVKVQAIDDIKTKVAEIENIKNTMASMADVQEINAKMAGIDDIQLKIANVESKVAGLDELRAKIVGMEEKLDAVLSFLHSRS